MHRLREVADENYCSVSDIARDILATSIAENEYEHTFLNKEAWAKAVKARDNARCVQCGSPQEVDVYEIWGNNGHNGNNGHHGNGKDELDTALSVSNGITLCYPCYRERGNADVVAANTNGHAVDDLVPPGWVKKYRRAREKGRVFWERHLACFLTQRKRTLSPIVEWYAETFLREVPEEVIIRTLVELCPSPDIIANFPSRQQSSPSETFEPPPLVWR